MPPPQAEGAPRELWFRLCSHPLQKSSQLPTECECVCVCVRACVCAHACVCMCVCSCPFSPCYWKRVHVLSRKTLKHSSRNNRAGSMSFNEHARNLADGAEQIKRRCGGVTAEDARYWTCIALAEKPWQISARPEMVGRCFISILFHLFVQVKQRVRCSVRFCCLVRFSYHCFYPVNAPLNCTFKGLVWIFFA